MKILQNKKLTSNKWLNLFESTTTKDGVLLNYWTFASRHDQVPITPDNKADAVVIIPIHIKNKIRRLVLINEFRVPLRDREVGFPAGIIDNWEIPENTAARELKEETGLNVFRILSVSPPVYSSAGMTDESIIFVIVECSGEPNTSGNEKDEDIKVMMLTRKELQKP